MDCGGIRVGILRHGSCTSSSALPFARLLKIPFSQVVIFPIFESRKSIAELFTAIVRDVFGGGKGAKKQTVAA